MSELGDDWKICSAIAKFMSPLNNFFDIAQKYEEEAPKGFNEAGKGVRSKEEYVKADIHYTKLEIVGEWLRKELEGKPSKVAGVGSLTFALKPLIGVTGSIDIIQFIMRTYAGTFGKYLAKVMNMSAGTFKEDGSIDTTKDYIETTLTLKLSVDADVGGSVGFDCANEEGKWGVAAGNTGINGFIGLSLAGEVGTKAQVWEIKFAASAAFKTVSEDGKGKAGIKLDFRPVVIAGERQWFGAGEFTGLAIEWALYVKTGRDGADSDTDDDKAKIGAGSFGGRKKPAQKSDESLQQGKDFKLEKKSKKPAILFKKRSLFDGKNAIKTSI